MTVSKKNNNTKKAALSSSTAKHAGHNKLNHLDESTSNNAKPLPAIIRPQIHNNSQTTDSSSNISSDASLDTESTNLSTTYTNTEYESSDSEDSLDESSIEGSEDLNCSVDAPANIPKIQRISPNTRYLYEGDDSSDEEDEERVYNSPIDLARYQEDELFEKVGSSNLNFSTALFLQDMGMRLLASTPVRKIYFPKKRSLGEFKNLPSDEEIKDNLTRSIKTLVKKNYSPYAKKLKAIINSDEFENFYQLLLTNKRTCFLSKTLLAAAEATELLKVVNEALKFDFEDAGRKKSAAERQIEGYITDLKKLKGGIKKGEEIKFLTPTGKISKDQSIVTQVKSYLDEKKDSYSKALLKAYLDSPARFTDLPTLIKTAWKKFQQKYAEDHDGRITLEKFISIITDGFSPSLSSIALIRPTLDDSTTMSAKDFDISEKDSHPVAFLAHMRLIHCSSKRYIKSEKALPESEKYGGNFSRAWKFNPEKSFSAITTKQLTKNLCLTDMVRYPYNDASYEALVSQFSKFQIPIRTSIECIKSLLKGQALPEVPSNFEKFISSFTYLIFGVEVERHPAAALHHMMGLDLMIKKGYDWKWFVDNMPMVPKGAVSACRQLDIEFKKVAAIPYYYDNNKNNVAGSDDLKKFIQSEKSLFSKWYKSVILVQLVDEWCSSAANKDKGLKHFLKFMKEKEEERKLPKVVKATEEWLLSPSNAKKGLDDLQKFLLDQKDMIELREIKDSDSFIPALDELCYDYLGLHLSGDSLQSSEEL